MKRLFLLIAILCMTIGCVSMTATSYYPEGKFPATNPDEVLILKSSPPQEHIVIGEVVLPSRKYDAQALRQKIAQIGGDAVILDIEVTPQPLLERNRPMTMVGPDGSIVTYNQPRVRAGSDTRILGKIIKFQR